MSTSSVSIHFSLRDKTQAVSFRLLLGLYSIIPVCLLLQCLDNWFWHDYLRNNLPSSPYHFVLFQILFGTPHIIASNILLVSNREYFNHFKRHIILMTIAIAVAYGVGNLVLPYTVLYSLVACWTVHHVLKQQYGIARGVCQLPDATFKLLLCLSVIAGVAIYLGIFLRTELDVEQALWISVIATAACILLFLAAFFNQNKVTTPFGRRFYWANIFLVLSSFYLYQQQQYFMAILVPRLVHDATAYIFYITHDYNKHNQEPQNFIYRTAANLKVPIFLVLPLLSFSLAFVLQAYGDDAFNWLTQTLLGKEFYRLITLSFLGYLALMHYYLEALTWQNKSPYRKYIAFRR